MHLFLNCLAASSASGLTYVRNVVPHLSCRPELRATLVLSPELRKGLGNPTNISFVERKIPAGTAGRFCWEQSMLPHDPKERRGRVNLGGELRYPAIAGAADTAFRELSLHFVRFL